MRSHQGPAYGVLLAVVLLACGEDAPPPPPARYCAPDAGLVPNEVVIPADEPSGCLFRRFSIPYREAATCGSLPADFGGGRVTLRGYPGTEWRVTVRRVDGAPERVCAAVLDASCACVSGPCTTGPDGSRLELDLGIVNDELVDLVLEPGTYDIDLCSM